MCARAPRAKGLTGNKGDVFAERGEIVALTKPRVLIFGRPRGSLPGGGGSTAEKGEVGCCSMREREQRGARERVGNYVASALRIRATRVIEWAGGWRWCIDGRSQTGLRDCGSIGLVCAVMFGYCA